MITQEKVRELFEDRNGVLVRKVASGKRGRLGSVVGWKNKDGYLFTRVEGKLYRNHRLIWLYHHGYLPENGIDHIDRDTSNNSVDNLREASKTCNMRNSDNSVANTSGVKGVAWGNREEKWRAYMTINHKHLYIGCFSDFTEAVCHRLAAEQCVGWSGCNSSSPAFQYMQRYIGRI